MANTIPASFTQLRKNLEITGLQKSTVSTRQQSVREAVERSFDVNDSFITGSYKRHTMISPLKSADVDVVVVLHSSYFKKDGQASLLDSVRAALLKTYPTTPKISRNGQAVTITFSDFRVDVVPAFNRKGGGYLIPDSIDKRWISTDPKKHETFISEANRGHPGSLVPVIKMVKGWNRAHGGSLKPFYLELLAEKATRQVTISNDWSGCLYIFDRGREMVKFKIHDPAQIGEGQVSGILTGSVDDAVKRFEAAYKQAKKAEELAAAGQISAAVAEWKKVFGDYFPTYR